MKMEMFKEDVGFFLYQHRSLEKQFPRDEIVTTKRNKGFIINKGCITMKNSEGLRENQLL